MTNTTSSPDVAAVRLRRALTDDAAVLSAFAAAAFHRTFGPDNDPVDMNAYLSSAFSPERQREELADPDRTCLIMESGDQIAGYALLRHPPSAAPAGEPSLEIQRFYVDESWHGQGLARRLMDACLDLARTQGATTIWLGVWERNARAIRFYTKQGFADVGSQEFRLGSDLQTDRVMSRPVGDRA